MLRCLFAKYFLLVFNLIIWLSGGVFLSCGIFLLYKHDLRSLFTILSYDSRLIPSFYNIGYILIIIGILIFLIGLIGCCGSVRESRILLGFYIFLIIIVMGCELIVAMYTVFLTDEWDTRLPNTLKKRLLTYNDTLPEQFEIDLDMIHKRFECCGIDGLTDFSKHQYPQSCCEQLLNGICIETNAYKIGCYQGINQFLHYYSRIIVAVGIAIALFELIALILAVCLCRNTIEDVNTFD